MNEQKMVDYLDELVLKLDDLYEELDGLTHVSERDIHFKLIGQISELEGEIEDIIKELKERQSLRGVLEDEIY